MWAKNVEYLIKWTVWVFKAAVFLITTLACRTSCNFRREERSQFYFSSPLPPTGAGSVGGGGALL